MARAQTQGPDYRARQPAEAVESGIGRQFFLPSRILETGTFN